MATKQVSSSNLIEVISVLGKKIRTSREYWNHITIKKHREVQGCLTLHIFS